MSARGIVLGASGLLLLLACESWDPSIRARERAAEIFSCESVELTQTEENRWHAIGCGHEGDFACPAGALEPVCIQVRTAGGEHAVDDEPEPPPDSSPPGARRLSVDRALARGPLRSADQGADGVVIVKPVPSQATCTSDPSASTTVRSPVGMLRSRTAE